MQSKPNHKISRAAAASILATSTVAMGLPAHKEAAVVFNDIKPSDFYYDAVMELAGAGIVSGYGNNLFRPNKSVTRGEAAKMLALSLNLDVNNAVNNSFPDVKKTNIFYKYISALANNGIISGFPDGTFRPEEVVQRSAMSRMIVEGYKFTLASKITYPFKDVSSTNYASYHIQTLYNLGIAKGTTAVKFDPNKAVTRGELASFISRANKANAGEPTYAISNVVGNKVYINSVGYTIGANVKAFIKEANRAALTGATIEGTFSGTTLTQVTKLTINATGSAANYYSLDGGGSTYNGELVLNGSYIRLKNWTLAGKTTIAETPRQSLASYNPLRNVLVATTSAGIIDWNTPTNPDDGNLNDGPGSGGLNDGLGSTKTYSAKLTPTLKLIDFTNVIVRNLIIEQNRTFVMAQTKLPKVTIRRDVAQVEINTNMGSLYLEGDDSLTIYGTHDIDTVYKNTYYSVYFNTDSEIGTLIVDNSNGWIDLGEFVYVDKVIIPPKTTPNDIFDDYKNDNDHIGTIEDNTGEEVDRDPIENGVVPDVTKPIINSLTLVPDSNKVTGTITVNETGKYYVVVVPKGTLAPTVREVVTNGISKHITEADINADGKYTQTFEYLGLTSVTDYTMYTVHVDDAGNFSSKNEQDFATKDGTPPEFTTAEAIGMVGGRRIQLNFKPTETGRYYYFIREAQNVDNTVTVEDIINGAQVTGIATADHVANGYSNILRVDENDQAIKPLTKYVVYAALVDDSGNKVTSVKALPVTTTALDETAPFVTGPNTNQLQQLVPVDSNKLNQFYMYFSEKLDKTTAENINNYSLSGTGIINVPGQESITPSSVKYEDTSTGGRVLITIPSLTGFVHGDTLRVTVSKNVLDLAEIPFENVDNAPSGTTPRNFAEYRHVDAYEPDLKIEKVERDALQLKAQVTYNASKAGTIYYMVIPDSVDINALGITKEDFVAEFGSKPTDKFTTATNEKIYLEGNKTTDLKEPMTTEIGDHIFVYDYKTLNPSPFESYSIYMVLKDRSGRLSPIMSKTMIADKEAPKISSFDVKPVNNSNTEVKVTLTSENEGGTTYIGYAPKYTKDTDSASTTVNKYILNRKVYSGGTPIVFANDTTLDNATRKQQFLDNVPNVKDKVLVKGANNEYTISNLTPNTEYVFYIATEDAYGNFTVKNLSQTAMIKEVYTDGIAPYINNQIVYRDIDDEVNFSNSPTTNPKFTITFSESILSEYEDTDPSVKTTLNKKSKIVKNKEAGIAINLADLLKIETVDSNGLVQDITSKFEFVDYTEAKPISSQSQLVIRALDRTYANKSFTVTFRNDENVVITDQTINNGLTFNLPGIYKYQGDKLNKFRHAILKDYVLKANVAESTVLDAGLDLGIDTDITKDIYYAVLNSTVNNINRLPQIYVENIIKFTNDSNQTNGSPGNGVTLFGKVNVGGVGSGAYSQVLNAIQYSNNTTSVFVEGHRIYLFTLDNYGNVNWAVKTVSQTDNTIESYYMTITKE